MTDADFMPVDIATFSGLPLWAQVVLGVVFVAKLVSIITPTQVDNELVGKYINPLLLILNRVLALNVGKAANADDPAAYEVVKAAGKIVADKVELQLNAAPKDYNTDPE